MTTFNDDTILIRGLDVTARRGEAAADLSDRAAGGVLLETLMGRYVLDSDAAVPWLLIDGRRDVRHLLDGVAERVGLPVDEIRRPTYELCRQLLEYGLVTVATPADIDALTRR
ncbi:PqqD family protein [Micromonospora echinospora]|uniref:PqqD family protein n=1 Tax=Micromonospora echinospora TaxID=1877 RepID=UPI003CF186B1